MSRKWYHRKSVLYGQRHTITSIPLGYGIAFIVDQKRKNKIYKQGKVDDRISILKLARSRTRRRKETSVEKWF